MPHRTCEAVPVRERVHHQKEANVEHLLSPKGRVEPELNVIEHFSHASSKSESEVHRVEQARDQVLTGLDLLHVIVEPLSVVVGQFEGEEVDDVDSQQQRDRELRHVSSKGFQQELKHLSLRKRDKEGEREPSAEVELACADRKEQQQELESVQVPAEVDRHEDALRGFEEVLYLRLFLSVFWVF